MIPGALIQLPTAALRALSQCITEATGTVPSRTLLRQILGYENHSIHEWLRAFHETYGSLLAAREVIAAILCARETSHAPEALFDLILSGPEVNDVPTCDTLPTIHQLIHDAKMEILICDYAVHGAESIFQHLSEAIQRNSSLRVRLVMHVFADSDSDPSAATLSEFRRTFLSRHWKSSQPPEIFVDPRCIATDRNSRASMHAKCFVSDDSAALITSANLTNAAHRKNIEAGVVVRYSPMVRRLLRYFNALIDEGILIPIEATS